MSFLPPGLEVITVMQGHGIDNPQRRRTEKRPFESWDELYALASVLGPRFGLLVVFAFPTSRGGYFDLHYFRAHHWKPAQIAAGIAPPRRIYDLRHTFATFALRAPNLHFRALALYGNEHRDDRSTSRPPRPGRQRAFLPFFPPFDLRRIATGCHRGAP
jgi:hypothetical protein